MQQNTIVAKGVKAMQKLIARSTKEEVKASIPAIRKYVHEHRNELEHCPFCNRNITDREESIYRELMESLYRVYRWCGERGVHEFEMKDIRHLLGQVNYTRFGNLHHYGGIIYRPEKSGKKSSGKFGINMERAREFFRNERDIPVKRVVSLVTGETVAETRVFMRDIPGLSQFMDEDGNYDHRTHLPLTATVPSRRGLPYAD